MLVSESEVHPRSTSTELRNYVESLGVQVSSEQFLGIYSNLVEMQGGQLKSNFSQKK